MHDYLYDVNTVRVAIVLSVIVSMLFYDRLQLTTGGAIVPGYLALSLPHPVSIITTLATSYVTFYLINKIIARRWIIYGRRKFELEVLIGLSILVVLWSLALVLPNLRPTPVVFFGIGFVIPGVIAHDAFRQGPQKTYAAILGSTAMIAILVYIFSSFTKGRSGENAEATPDVSATLGFDIDLLLPAIVLSVVVGMLVFGHLGLRTGGFVSGAYLALELTRIADVIYIVILAALVYVIVTKVLMKHLLIFGRRKLGMMVLVAAIAGWTSQLVLAQLTGQQYIAWEGFSIISFMVPALIANDAERQGLSRTMWGLALTTLAVFTSMNFVEALLNQSLI